MKCTAKEIRGFLLRQPRAEHVRVSVEGKLMYVGIEGQNLARVSETVAALHPERIDIMAKHGPGTALDGKVLRSADVETHPTSKRVEKRLRVLEDRVKELERLGLQRESRVIAVVDSRTNYLMAEVRAAARQLRAAEKLATRRFNSGAARLAVKRP